MKRESTEIVLNRTNFEYKYNRAEHWKFPSELYYD